LGAAKAGTSTLYAYLSEVPTLCMSQPKEPFFFEAEFAFGLEHCRQRYYPNWTPAQIPGEARHRNLYLPFVPERIHSVNPSAKLIVALRNPIERAYSHWWYFYARGIEQLSFEDAIREDLERIQAGWRLESAYERQIYQLALDYTGKGIYRTYIDSGYYLEQIARYLRCFPLNQFKFVLFEDLIHNLPDTVRDIEEWLGVAYHTSSNFVARHENPSLPATGAKLKAELEPRFRGILADHFQAQNQGLDSIIGRDLSDWK
jgi:hypothetical protein